MNYTRYIKGIKVRLIQFSDREFHIFIGNKLYAIIDYIGDAYREYNAINEQTVAYIG